MDSACLLAATTPKLKATSVENRRNVMSGFSKQFLNLQKAIRQQALIHKRLAEQQRQFGEALRRSVELSRRSIEEPLRQIVQQQQQFVESFQRSVELPRRRLEEVFRRQQQLADSLRQVIDIPKRFFEQPPQIIESFRRPAEALKELPERERRALQRSRRRRLVS